MNKYTKVWFKDSPIANKFHGPFLVKTDRWDRPGSRFHVFKENGLLYDPIHGPGGARHTRDEFVEAETNSDRGSA